MRHYYKSGGKVKSGGKICPKGKAWAKRTFDTYPSAYANMAASKYCKDPNYAKGKKKKWSKTKTKERTNNAVFFTKSIWDKLNKDVIVKEPYITPGVISDKLKLNVYF